MAAAEQVWEILRDHLFPQGQSALWAPPGSPALPGASAPPRGRQSCQTHMAWADCWEQKLGQMGTIEEGK